MTVIISLLIILFVVGLLLLIASWFAHISMVVDECPRGWGTFKAFKSEYSKREWNREEKFGRGHFGKEGYPYQNYIWADIIKFGGVGMVLYPWSFIAFKIWELEHELPKEKVFKKGYWKQS